MSKMMIGVGHPQRATFCEAIGRSYAQGATSAGHDAKLFLLADMHFDAILHDGYRKEQPLEPDLRAAHETLASCDHLVLIFPLWCGDMPGMLKGFTERILQPDLIAREKTENDMNWHIFANKTARIAMTMGMPVSIYRWWYGGSAWHDWEKPAARERWLREIEALGKAAN